MPIENPRPWEDVRPRPWEDVRAASVRWRRLSALLGLIERCIEANGQLDVSRREDGRPSLSGRVRRVDAQLAIVTRRLGLEVSRVTQEQLLVELQRRQARATS